MANPLDQPIPNWTINPLDPYDRWNVRPLYLGPVGSSQVGGDTSVSMPSSDVSPIAGWYGAHPQTEAGRADAMRLAGNMAQFGPADVGSVGNAARLARAGEMGFDTSRTLYHYTPYDFSEFVPGQWRGASYFSETPEGALRGAAAGGMEHPALSGPTGPGKLAGPQIMPVYVAGKIWGRDPLPSDWLPETLTYGQYKDIISGKDRIAPEGFTKQEIDSINYERVNAARKFYTEAVPESEYQNYAGENENKMPMKLEKPPVAEPFQYADIEGTYSSTAFAPSGSMSPAVRRDMLRKLGYSGWAVNDEGGRSIAVADPTKIRAVTANFDPAKAGSSNILYGIAGLLGGGAAAGAATQQPQQ